jgi:phenylacetate-CoA ligase
MPLIRYQIGDRGSLIPKSERPTGLPFPCLSPVQGRTSEAFRLPNGVILPGEYLTTLFDDFPDMVTGFQVKLTSEGKIEILYTSNSDESELKKTSDSIVHRLKQKINYSVPVICKRVQALKNDRGKTRYILNEFSNSRE